MSSPIRTRRRWIPAAYAGLTAMLTFAAGSAVVAHSGGNSNQALNLTATPVTGKTPLPAAKGVKPSSVYIIQLDAPAVAQYQGGINSFAGTSNQVTGNRLLDINSADSKAYAGFLRSQQAKVVASLGSSPTGAAPQVVYSYLYSLNGIAVKMSHKEAQRIRQLPGIKRVMRDYIHYPETDRGPAFIGAPSIWEGNGSGVSAQGEGMVIGILDSGVNQGHPSFAEVGSDGYGANGEYAATNPFGAGNFAGGPRDDCSNPAFPGLCNNKLIGSYAFLDAHPGGVDPFSQPGDPSSKDTDGHGSHVMSTAAGNHVSLPPLFDADGNDTGLSLGDISGVAPHAHVIAYKVCAPGCASSDIIAAVDQAIIDGVHALNHSIGAASGSPWSDAKSLSFLAAYAAGIMVQNSAGNSGPGAGTAARISSSPWATGVAASTHDRAFPIKQLENMSGGDTAAPADINGRSVTEGFSGTIVYAGDFPVGNPGEPNFDTPEQCLEAFPPGTFDAGQIVVCDRGAIARVQKGRNVRDGGAGGFVLANTDGGASSTNDDLHVLPAIHINAADGNSLRQWLASGTDHQGTITGTGPAQLVPGLGDIMADFSSRGPYTGFDMLAPHVSAPGANIYAAGADLQFVHPGLATADPDDDPSVTTPFGIISGTSMSSPHATGSAALLKQLHPTWSPSAIKSALMTTGVTDMRKEDGVTPADPFDYGAGRINLEDASRVGLVLNETTANMLAGNPASGGDPQDINVADMVDETCAPTCGWTRTVTNVTDQSTTWNVSYSAAPGMQVNVAPGSFTLGPGESQAIDVDVDVSGATQNAWNFAEIQLDAQGNDLPQQRLPIAANFTTATNAQVFTKEVDKAQAASGEVVTYQLHLTNAGEAGSFTVNDVLPPGASYVASSATTQVDGGTTTSPFSFDANSNSLSWTGLLDGQTLQLDASPSPFGFFSPGALGVPPLGCPGNCDDGGFAISGLDIHYLGQHYTTAIMSVNGTLELGTESGLVVGASNTLLPDPTPPNNLLAPFWTDLNLGDGGEWYAATLSAGPQQFFVASWENVPLFGNPTTFSFQIWMENGTSNIWFVYGDVPAIPTFLTVGFEDEAGAGGDSRFFDGEGIPPVAGVDLKVQAIPGGHAMLSFQAELTGDEGDTITNLAEALNGVMETALAVTEIIVPDIDNDGVPDGEDNCLKVPNPSQCDSDNDNYGNHCDADFNGDMFVNFADLSLMRANFFGNSAPPAFSEFDLDCNGEIDFDDVNRFRELFNAPPGPSGLTE